MSQLILSINAGSSSLKTTLYSTGEEKKLRKLAKAEVSSIGDKATLKYEQDEHERKDKLEDVKDHRQAFECVLNAFLEDEHIALKSKDDINYACHRVVQGGDFEEDQLITQETFHKIEALSDLAPLHNASAVALMIACHEHLPNVTNVACFDSGFHHTIPSHVKSYAIDQKIAREKGLRKYGFHGLSYSYIIKAVADYLGKPVEETSIIALHLGSGASACAIQNGKSIDTTMGLTPVSGLPGGSRSGDVDPALVFHYTSEASKLSPSSTKDLHISTAEEILNKQSGWKALTGTSDFAEIGKPDAPQSHQLAFNLFVDRIIGFVGNYYVKLGGNVDALVFSGGIGEKSAYLRQAVTEKCSCLSFSINQSKNDDLSSDGEVFDIGAGSKPLTLVCQTDEDVSPFAYREDHVINLRASIKWLTTRCCIRSEGFAAL